MATNCPVCERPLKFQQGKKAEVWRCESELHSVVMFVIRKKPEKQTTVQCLDNQVDALIERVNQLTKERSFVRD